MSDPLGSYSFLSWIRRGVGVEIARVDGTGNAPRAEIPVTISLNQGTLSAPVALAFIGPGEVAGVDPRVVARTWPLAGVACPSGTTWIEDADRLETEFARVRKPTDY